MGGYFRVFYVFLSKRYLQIFLTNISQSEFPISIPYQQLPYSPSTPYILPIHISKLPASPGLMPPLHPLTYVLLSGASHSVAPTPGPGIDGPGNTHMLPSFSYLVCFIGQNPVSYFTPLSSPPSPCSHITQAALSGVVSQVRPQYNFPFCAARDETGFCVCVSHHSILCLC